MLSGTFQGAVCYNRVHSMLQNNIKQLFGLVALEFVATISVLDKIFYWEEQ